LSRSDTIAKILLVFIILLVVSSILSYLLKEPAYSASTLIRIAAAKCPGIPGGAGSGGPDYINITIDYGLVGLFVLFLMLTVKDMRKRRRLGGGHGP
jgi:hypothetical protein